tara:strand:- start:599 stop:1339 length:741 start_codon:yes stop_codon:yes gene_type:complete
MNEFQDIDLTQIPQHIAIIMDGNGRWAKKQMETRTFGHNAGVEAVRQVVEGCVELGVKHLTLYAFSTENWNRPQYEVDALMTLLVKALRAELKTFQKNGVKLNTIGDLGKLPNNCQTQLLDTFEATKDGDRLQLNLALSYSSRWEILRAVNSIVKDIRVNDFSEEVTESVFKTYLDTKDIPDPDLLIRTSGEFRISNFLLWQLAYAELYFTEVFWPDFSKKELAKAILDFQKRERRFGKTSEQVKS